MKQSRFVETLHEFLLVFSGINPTRELGTLLSLARTGPSGKHKPMPPLHKMISNYYVRVRRPITEYLASKETEWSVCLNSLLPRKTTRHFIHSHERARSLNFPQTPLEFDPARVDALCETACFYFTGHPPSPLTSQSAAFVVVRQTLPTASAL